MNIGVIFLLITLTECAIANDDRQRVYNGEKVKIGDQKHLVQIESTTNRCSASIIDPNWVLTAAHCVYRTKPGTQHIIRHHSSNWAIAYARKSFHHPAFHWPGHGNTLTSQQINVDLALLKTEQPIMFNENIQPIRLVNRAPAVNKAAMIAGYGETNMASPFEQNRWPFKGELKIVECDWGFLGTSVICLRGLVSAGRGDSGGPLTTEEGLIGVQSASRCMFTPGDSECDTFCVNLADPRLAMWIQKVMWTNVHNRTAIKKI